MLFAATDPERTAALILYGTFAKGSPTEDEIRDAGFSPTDVEAKTAEFEVVLDHWGEGRLLDVFAPSIAGRLSFAFPHLAKELVKRAWRRPSVARCLPLLDWCAEFPTGEAQKVEQP